MKRMTSTQAKQSFGELLASARSGPVSIEKHRKVQVIVASPEAFALGDSARGATDARRLARAQQAIVERDRLIRHHRIALSLLTLPARERERLIRDARAVVEQWRHDGTCSGDYIERWSEILQKSAAEMAASITSEMGGWGSALRQNSPWIGAPA